MENENTGGNRKATGFNLNIFDFCSQREVSFAQPTQVLSKSLDVVQERTSNGYVLN